MVFQVKANSKLEKSFEKFLGEIPAVQLEIPFNDSIQTIYQNKNYSLGIESVSS